jgi:putative flippase GtrA
MGTPRLVDRWAVFNLVGLAGMAVQLGLVAFLVHALGWHYLVATGVGVEAAILHNFAWHHRWTWRDRPASSRRELGLRLARFQLLNGMVSLAGNLGLTALGTGLLHVGPVVSNLIAIAVCASVNFAASNVAVFRAATVAGVMILVITPAPASAGPAASTVAAWRAYEAQLESAYKASAAAPAWQFFVHDRASLASGWRRGVMQGTPSVSKIDAPPVEDGKIHHWVGAMFIPGISVEAALDRLQGSAGNESRSYPDVLASRLIERNGERARVFMKLRRESVITVTYNTEHVVDYTRVTPTRALVRSVATKITELAGAGTRQEREKPASDDNGFLWRLNAYWRYEAVPGGVIVECESVSLSRPVPLVIRPLANPVVDRIARESMTRTLTSLRILLAQAPAVADRR